MKALGFFEVPDEIVLKAIEERGMPARETVIAKAEHLFAATGGRAC